MPWFGEVVGPPGGGVCPPPGGFGPPGIGVGPVEAVAAPGVHSLFQSYCFGCGRWNRPCGRSIRSIVSDSCGSPDCGGGGHAARPPVGGGGVGPPLGGGGVGPPEGGGADRNCWPIAGDCVVTAGGCPGAAPPGAASCCPQLPQNCVPGCTE